MVNPGWLGEPGARRARGGWVSRDSENDPREPPPELREPRPTRMLALTYSPFCRSGCNPGGARMGQIPQPALATLSHDRFWREGWVYERKLDGQRCLAVRRDGQARLYSRQGKDSSAAFPEIADALSGPGQDFIIDGEIVAFEGAHT